jgi:hypothetical protein
MMVEPLPAPRPIEPTKLPKAPIETAAHVNPRCVRRRRLGNLSDVRPERGDPRLLYHIFTRGTDRKYDAVYAERFVHDADAMTFAKKLLTEHPVAEVWRGETFVAEVNRRDQIRM